MNTRKIYETPYDRTRQIAIADRLAEMWGAEFVELPRKSVFDYAAMVGNDLQAWVEVKYRNNTKTKFNEYMVSFAKVQAGKRFNEDTQKPALLVCEWTDMTHMVDLAHCDFRVGWGGTQKRNDPEDMEPMAFIDIDQFTPIQWLRFGKKRIVIND